MPATRCYRCRLAGLISRLTTVLQFTLNSKLLCSVRTLLCLSTEVSTVCSSGFNPRERRFGRGTASLPKIPKAIVQLSNFKCYHHTIRVRYRPRFRLSLAGAPATQPNDSDIMAYPQCIVPISSLTNKYIRHQVGTRLAVRVLSFVSLCDRIRQFTFPV